MSALMNKRDAEFNRSEMGEPPASPSLVRDASECPTATPPTCVEQQDGQQTASSKSELSRVLKCLWEMLKTGMSAVYTTLKSAWSWLCNAVHGQAAANQTSNVDGDGLSVKVSDDRDDEGGSAPATPLFRRSVSGPPSPIQNMYEIEMESSGGGSFHVSDDFRTTPAPGESTDSMLSHLAAEKRVIEFEKELRDSLSALALEQMATTAGSCWKLLVEQPFRCDPALLDGPMTRRKLIFLQQQVQAFNWSTRSDLSLVRDSRHAHITTGGVLSVYEVINALPLDVTIGSDLVQPVRRDDETQTAMEWLVGLILVLQTSLFELVRAVRASYAYTFSLHLFFVLITIARFALKTVLKLVWSDFFPLRVRLWLMGSILIVSTQTVTLLRRGLVADVVVVICVVGVWLGLLWPIAATGIALVAMVPLTAYITALAFGFGTTDIVAIFTVLLEPVTQLVTYTAGYVVGTFVNARITWAIYSGVLTRNEHGHVSLGSFEHLGATVELDDRYVATSDFDREFKALRQMVTPSAIGFTVGFSIVSMGFVIGYCVLFATIAFYRLGSFGMTTLTKLFMWMVLALLMPDDVALATWWTLEYARLFAGSLLHSGHVALHLAAGSFINWCSIAINALTTQSSVSMNGIETHYTLPTVKWSLFRRRAINLVRLRVTTFVVMVESVDIPRMLRQKYVGVSKETIRETLETMKELGLPVNVELHDLEEHETQFLGQHSSWAVLGSNFRQQIAQLRLGIGVELQGILGLNPPTFKHTAGYTSEEREAESTARYYKDNVTEPSLEGIADDTYNVLHDHFDGSVLAKTSRVVASLVKKYSMGFGFMSSKRPGRAATRKEVIAQVGGIEAFQRIFDRLAVVAPRLVPISHVFTKFETLKESKWMKGIVRTIVGVPLAHYSLTSRFSFHQNARHPFDTSPVKVGMPLTGGWFDPLWQSHAKRAHHFNGDLTAADSSYSRDIFNVIAAVRKKGFAGHKNFDDIAGMIDVAYDQLMTMPLAYKANGVITKKGDGGATGQGNTSLDNSVALVVAYMSAWKAITGKSAKEFMLYNTLSNQADDHILSWDDNPFGWNPDAIIAHFGKLGLKLRDEAGSDKLEDCVFLAKQITPHRMAAVEECKKAGLPVPEYTTCHVRERLLGKVAAEQPLRDRQARAKRLASMLYLTAHHKDIYLELVGAIRKLQRNHPTGLGVKVPPYNVILKLWYERRPLDKKLAAHADETADFTAGFDEAMAQFGEVDDVVHIRQSDAVDVVLLCLAMVPQTFSPRFQTTPAVRHMHRLLGPRVGWVVNLFKDRNPSLKGVEAIQYHATRTIYAFCSMAELDTTSVRIRGFQLLAAHWIYMFLSGFFGLSNRQSWWAKLTRGADALIANFYFSFSGQVVDGVDMLDTGYLETALLVIAESLARFAPVQKPPTLPLFIPSNFLYTMAIRGWRSVQPGASVDMGVLVDHVTSPFFGREPLIVRAPTGSGKSTRMVSKLASLVAPRRLFVIEPRHILVTGLVPYMRKMDQTTTYGGATAGMKPRPDDRVVYCTYQSFIMSGYGTGTDVVLVDEAHITDPVHKLCVADMLSRDITVILTTATPDPSWLLPGSGFNVVDLEVASTYRIVENTIRLQDYTHYYHEALGIVRGLRHTTKALVFFPTVKECLKFAEATGRKCSVISSKTPSFDDESTVYVSTRVADAGLTIPDVEFVITSDIDIDVVGDVVTTGRFPSYQPMPVKYRVDALTIKQRRGRTGRTCDGTFVLFNVMAQFDPRKSTPGSVLKDMGELVNFDTVTRLLDDETRQLLEDLETIAADHGFESCLNFLDHMGYRRHKDSQQLEASEVFAAHATQARSGDGPMENPLTDMTTAVKTVEEMELAFGLKSDKDIDRERKHRAVMNNFWGVATQDIHGRDRTNPRFGMPATNLQRGTASQVTQRWARRAAIEAERNQKQEAENLRRASVELETPEGGTLTEL